MFKKKDKELMLAYGDKRFWLADGRTLDSFIDLRDALKDMDERTFKYHVGNGKNDFANWVEGVFSEKKLASLIGRVRTQKSMLERLEKYLLEEYSIK